MDEQQIKDAVKLIVSSKFDVNYRVHRVVSPGAPYTEGAQYSVRQLLSDLFDAGEILCPRCKSTCFDAENYCFMDAACPVTADVPEGKPIPTDNILPCFYCQTLPHEVTHPTRGNWRFVFPNQFMFRCTTYGCAGQTTRWYGARMRAINNWNLNVRAKGRITRNAIATKPPLWREHI